MRAIENMPILEEYEELTSLWDSVYEERKKKVGSKKAKYSANAVVGAKLLEIFLEERS